MLNIEFSKFLWVLIPIQKNFDFENHHSEKMNSVQCINTHHHNETDQGCTYFCRIKGRIACALLRLLHCSEGTTSYPHTVGTGLLTETKLSRYLSSTEHSAATNLERAFDERRVNLKQQVS